MGLYGQVVLKTVSWPLSLKNKKKITSTTVKKEEDLLLNVKKSLSRSGYCKRSQEGTVFSHWFNFNL
jgi:hypothetical protein